MELITFNSEVSTGEFTCVKPEPQEQVAQSEEKISNRRKLYISLHSSLQDSQNRIAGLCEPSQNSVA